MAQLNSCNEIYQKNFYEQLKKTKPSLASQKHLNAGGSKKYVTFRTIIYANYIMNLNDLFISYMVELVFSTTEDFCTRISCWLKVPRSGFISLSFHWFYVLELLDELSVTCEIWHKRISQFASTFFVMRAIGAGYSTD